MNQANANVEQMKVYVLQSENGIIMNFGVSVKKKKKMLGLHDCMWNAIRCDCECNKIYKIDEQFNIKNCPSEKHLTGKIVLECEDEILNKTETLLMI